jgi:hypothetical protein
MNPLTKTDLLDVLEHATLAQLRALRSLRQAQATKRPPAEPGRKSNMAIVHDILVAANGPLHIDEIIRQAKQAHHRSLQRESLVSALTKKVLDQNTYRRTAPNTFDLLARPA